MVSGFWRFIIACNVLLFCVLTVGCGGDSQRPTPIQISGTVTFDGKPVEKGEVSFEDPQTGAAASATLGPEGKYTLAVPAGSYQVGITPPTVVGEAQEDTPADFIDYEKVDNIPQKYYWGGESGLTATVSESAITHDFDMQPN